MLYYNIIFCNHNYNNLYNIICNSELSCHLTYPTNKFPLHSPCSLPWKSSILFPLNTFNMIPRSKARARSPFAEHHCRLLLLPAVTINFLLNLLFSFLPLSILRLNVIFSLPSS